MPRFHRGEIPLNPCKMGLPQCLSPNFLGAKNCERMKFYIMYANRDVNRLWDNKVGRKGKGEIVWYAKPSDADWRTIVARWIGQYFMRPNYYKIKGCPVLMIYDVDSFVKWNGEVVAKERIAYLRQEVKKAGFPDVHLQLRLWRGADLGADSMTLYNWRDMTSKRVDSTTEPELTYREWGELAATKIPVRFGIAENFAKVMPGGGILVKYQTNEDDRHEKGFPCWRRGGGVWACGRFRDGRSWGGC